MIAELLSNPDFDIPNVSDKVACVLDCCENGIVQAERAKGYSGIVLFGITSAGKSTLANYIHGCEMESPEFDRIQVKSSSKIREIMKVTNQLMYIAFSNSKHLIHALYRLVMAIKVRLSPLMWSRLRQLF
jgi:polynucleotide 5'-kinase involved in rRNA processing